MIRSTPADDIAALLGSIRDQCDGMMPLEIYGRLFRAAGQCGGGSIVEIGTAGGAAAVVMARGARAAGAALRVYTADPFDRGSRQRVGSIEHNVALVLERLRLFGVADDITLVAGQAVDLAAQGDPEDIRLLLLDADGRIDRDLAPLFDRLAHDATIVIDDVDGLVYAHRKEHGWKIDQKHRLTRLLCNALCDRGVLVEFDTVGQTGFFRKGPARMSQADWAAIALDVYPELVFSHVDTERLVSRAGLRGRLRTRLPWLARLYRRVRSRLNA